MITFEELLQKAKELYGSGYVHQFNQDFSYFYIETINMEFYRNGTIQTYIECHDCGNQLNEVIAENKTPNEMLQILIALA